MSTHRELNRAITRASDWAGTLTHGCTLSAWRHGYVTGLMAAQDLIKKDEAREATANFMHSCAPTPRTDPTEGGKE